MSVKWDFKPKKVHYQTLRGDTLPHLEVSVFANGKKVGYIEVHMHSHRGRDKKVDVSFGFTGVVEKMPEDEE